MPRIIRILLLLGLLIAASISIGIEAQAASSRIDVLYATGTINPVLANYIERGMSRTSLAPKSR